MFRNIFSLSLVCIFFLSFVSHIHALTPTSSPSSTLTPTIADSENKEGLKFGPTIKKTFENRLELQQKKREALKTLIEQKKETMEQRREALNTKMAAFKDQRRKNLVLNLDAKISSISAKRVEKMNQAVARLEEILDGIKTKSDSITGCDKTTLDSVITNAENELNVASNAIEEQAEKIYSITISTEETTKNDVGATIRLLMQDLRSSHQKVVNLKKAIVKAATTLRLTKTCTPITSSPIPTTSATPSATIAPTGI